MIMLPDNTRTVIQNTASHRPERRDSKREILSMTECVTSMFFVLIGFCYVSFNTFRSAFLALRKCVRIVFTGNRSRLLISSYDISSK